MCVTSVTCGTYACVVCERAVAYQIKRSQVQCSADDVHFFSFFSCVNLLFTLSIVIKLVMSHLISFAACSLAKLQENLPPLAGVTMKMVATVF